MAGLKTCSKCKEVKSLGGFWNDRHRPDGKRGACRACCQLQHDNWVKNQNNRCPDCDKLISPNRTYCRRHMAYQERSGRWKGGRSKDGKGYVVLSGKQGHPNARVGGQIAEHTFVMVQHLGRPLLPEERVHHINGIKDDNRIENLELWTKEHPSGQRVADQVAWAKLILARYDPSALATALLGVA